MNHQPSDIAWAEFGKTCAELCSQYKRACYIKDDLRDEMARGGKIDFSDCPYWKLDFEFTINGTKI
jgi:hypothetical protein